MKQSVMKKWVKALRSGKYKQTDSALKDGAGHCCLGVLSSISPHKNNFTRMKPPSSEYDKNAALPCLIQKWAGMKNEVGQIDSDTCLASMNDNGASFEQIADFIEKNWEKL